MEFVHLKVSFSFHESDRIITRECAGALPPLRLFEMGFAEQLQEIIRRLPDVRQTLLFSATLPKLLVEFARAGEISSVSHPAIKFEDVFEDQNHKLTDPS